MAAIDGDGREEVTATLFRVLRRRRHFEEGAALNEDGREEGRHLMEVFGRRREILRRRWWILGLELTLL